MDYYLKCIYNLNVAKEQGTMGSIFKELREFTGYSLKDAKRVIDEIRFRGYSRISESEYNRLLNQYEESSVFYVEKDKEMNESIKKMLVSVVYELVKNERFERAIQTLELLQHFKEDD